MVQLFADLFSGRDRFNKDYVPNAKGGVYTTPTLGLVGEASTHSNPELITPQALLDDRLAANNARLANDFYAAASAIVNAINNKDMTVAIGDAEIAASAARGNNAYYKMNGKPLFV